MSRRNDYGLVLVVDPSAKTACISLGYAIEPYFKPKILQQMMQIIGGHLSQGAFGMAIQSSCIRAGEVLRKHAQALHWKPETAAVADSIPDMGLQPLRGGHRPASRPLTESFPART
ncbi:hypothetical protein [Prosthecobacter sp.]|uniref:hypothetical protein n=1 Tax=Prosthecobacter sp. TaxID=1965333 RepID=UPI00378347D7